MARLILVMLFSTLISACGLVDYKSPTTGNLATIEFASKLNSGAMLSIIVYQDSSTCSKGRTVAYRQHGFSNKVIRVPANQEFTFMIHYDRSEVVGRYVHTISCRMIQTFIPGRYDYRINTGFSRSLRGCASLVAKREGMRWVPFKPVRRTYNKRGSILSGNQCLQISKPGDTERLKEMRRESFGISSQPI